MSDIVSGAYHKPLKERLLLLGKLKTRFPVAGYDFPAGLRAIDEPGQCPGPDYDIIWRETSTKLPEPHIGATTTHGEGQSNNALICKSTPTQMATAFLGPLLGVEVNTNTTKVYPGALFRDDDIVRGIFTR